MKYWLTGLLVMYVLVMNGLTQGIDPFSSAGGNAADETRLSQGALGNIDSVQFVDMEVTGIFKMISDLTGWSIIMSPKVSKAPPKINIWIKDMSPKEVLERIVSIAGLVLDGQEGSYNVLTFDEYIQLNGVDKEVYTLKHARANEIVKIMKPFVAQDDQTKIIADVSTNQVILLIPSPQMDSFRNLIEMLDVPFEKEVVKAIHLEYLSAENILDELKEFFKGVTQSNSGTSGRITQTDNNAATPQGLEEWLIQFMVEPKLNVIILRGLPSYVQSAAELIQQLDVKYEEDTVKMIPLQYQEAQLVVASLENFLGRDSQLQGRQTEGTNTQLATAESLDVWPIRFMVDTKFNAIILRGKSKYVQRAVDLISQMDKDPSIEIRNYTLKYTNAENVYGVLREIISEEELQGRSSSQSGVRTIPRLKIAPNEQNNTILIEGSVRDHERLSKILEAIDVPMLPGTGGMRVYRLENTSSKEVVTVLKALVEERNNLAKRQTSALSVETSRGGDSATASVGASENQSTSLSSSSGTQAGFDILPAIITEAPEINAIIISASAQEHEEFATIIDEMDKPREQVVLEVTLVSIQSTDSFELGVELGSELTSDKTQVVGFSNFGISTINSGTGNLSLPTNPAFGLNTGIFYSSDMSLVLNALKTVGKTRITSRPKVLVEDNATGFISQTSQEPYETVSQGNNTTITSFGGYVEAGTVLQVIPYISDDEWLRLEYQIQLSSFGTRTSEQEQANLPPPQERNVVQGSVRIPTGHTVVLGGLVTGRQDDVQQGIPWLSDIPLIGSWFKNTSLSNADNTLFIFIRPEVMRDPQYRDLMRLSREDAEQAKIDIEQGPVNTMMLMAPLDMENSQ